VLLLALPSDVLWNFNYQHSQGEAEVKAVTHQTLLVRSWGSQIEYDILRMGQKD